MGNLDYTQVLNKIENTRRFGNEPGVVVTAQVIKVLREKGKQKRIIPYIHVAGTNGKGSVIAYLYTTLTGAGYRVGRYISPTLYSYRERLEVAGEKISRVEAKALDAEAIQTQLQAFLDEYNKKQPTYRHITGLVVRKNPFLRSTTKKIRRQDVLIDEPLK